MKFGSRVPWLGWALFPLATALVDCEYTEVLTQCEELLVRREWRTLCREDQQSYIEAVKCLMGKPVSAIGDVLPGATSRFEEFLGDHILQTDANHFVGHFYPWHRLLLWAYEREIRDCGYTGAQPYWDWSLDANAREDMFKSPIFDPETGFGGNGEWVPGTMEDPEPGITVTATGVSFSMDDRSGGGCIPNGPFANLTIHMGPRDNVEYNPWCVRRDFVPSQFVNAANSTTVAEGMALPDYGYFSKITQDSLHNAGHLGVGGLYGTLTDVYSSPGDPIFFLHHTNLDRAWWSWQARDLDVRIEDMSGPQIPFDYTNEKGRNVTLDDTVYLGAAINMTVSIRDLMDIRNSLLCYTYDTLY